MTSKVNESKQIISRNLAEKDLAFDKIAEEWHTFIANYDTNRRIEVLVSEFLGPSIEGKSCLDGGCGLGYFTLALQKYNPSSITAIDISPKLISRISENIPSITAQTADLLVLSKTIDKKFDIVLSSEVIEHTPDPKEAVKQLCLMLKSGGLIAISCPNRRWIWLLKLAQIFKLRSNYKGYENWAVPKDLQKWIQDENCEILRKEGIHFIPWQFLPKKLLRFIDTITRDFSYSFALNLAILAKKR